MNGLLIVANPGSLLGLLAIASDVEDSICQIVGVGDYVAADAVFVDSALAASLPPDLPARERVAVVTEDLDSDVGYQLAQKLGTHAVLPLPDQDAEAFLRKLIAETQRPAPMPGTGDGRLGDPVTYWSSSAGEPKLAFVLATPESIVPGGPIPVPEDGARHLMVFSPTGNVYPVVSVPRADGKQHRGVWSADRP